LRVRIRGWSWAMGERLWGEKPFNIQGLLITTSYELYSKGGMDEFRSYV